MGKKEKPILCLIDAQNIYYTPKHFYNSAIDFKKLYNRLRAKAGQSIYVIIYLVADAVIDQVQFLNVLHKIGYHTRLKLMRYEKGHSQNTNWDEEMIVEGMELMPFYSGLALVSGDHGFIPMLNKWSAANKSTKILSFERDMSFKLVQSEHPTDFLGQDVIRQNCELQSSKTFQNNSK